MFFTTLSTLALLGATALAAPTDLATRANQMCGQYQQQSSGPYTLSTNGWSWSSGKGSQCSQINSLNGNTISWSTTWSWANTPTQVKSYTNVITGIAKKKLSVYKSIPTAWKWGYTGTGLRANVAYDMFIGSSPNGANTFEVMVWLGLLGDVSPLSANGYPFVSEQ